MKCDRIWVDGIECDRICDVRKVRSHLLGLWMAIAFWFFGKCVSAA
ncbi:hypothetical protein [Nostoc sp. ChiVER01]|nr:hypothetical protein [Nostoc sp. ChiVER01]MDZ8224213.1 hypothetical protein [Nostoc sp. ChiVER01]